MDQMANLVDNGNVEQLKDFILGIKTTVELEQARVSLIGKKGLIGKKMSQLGRLDAAQRKTQGKFLNELKQVVIETLVVQKSNLRRAEIISDMESHRADVSLPVHCAPYMNGRLHPMKQTLEELVDCFTNYGFDLCDGPDIETDYYNFTALNIPAHHPARDMHDTFFMDNEHKTVLRTHTSPVQIRSMEKIKPPLRIMAAGVVYRHDSDQTHVPAFHQLEGLVVDTKSNLAELKWLLMSFCSDFFGVKSDFLRFRPHFFPFTEPSYELDILCKRDGNSLILGEGNEWLEVLGCGMVHPNVLRNVGLDPEQYQGYALGMGVDRLTMIKYGIADLRSMFCSDYGWIQKKGVGFAEILCNAKGIK